MLLVSKASTSCFTTKKVPREISLGTFVLQFDLVFFLLNPATNICEGFLQ